SRCHIPGRQRTGPLRRPLRPGPIRCPRERLALERRLASRQCSLASAAGTDIGAAKSGVTLVQQELVDARHAAEESHTAARMQKQDVFVLLELLFVGDEAYQAVHGFAGVNRIQQYALVARNRCDGRERARRGRAMDLADAIGVHRDIAPRGSLLEPEKRRGLPDQVVYLLFQGQLRQPYANAENRNLYVRKVKPNY